MNMENPYNQHKINDINAFKTPESTQCPNCKKLEKRIKVLEEEARFRFKELKETKQKAVIRESSIQCEKKLKLKLLSLLSFNNKFRKSFYSRQGELIDEMIQHISLESFESIVSDEEFEEYLQEYNFSGDEEYYHFTQLLKDLKTDFNVIAHSTLDLKDYPFAIDNTLEIIRFFPEYFASNDEIFDFLQIKMRMLEPFK